MFPESATSVSFADGMQLPDSLIRPEPSNARVNHCSPTDYPPMWFPWTALRNQPVG
jgi:hypothetical protein